jgi:hypothetical protein
VGERESTVEEMDMGSFVEIPLGGKTGTYLQSCFIVAHSSLAISHDIGLTLANTTEDVDKDKLRLKIEYSAKYRAIRCTALPWQSSSGFAFKREGANKSYRRTNIPRHFKERHIPKGVYRPHPKYPGVFVLDVNKESKER